MSLQQMQIGMHALLNNYSGSSAEAHVGASLRYADIVQLAVDAGSNIVRIPANLGALGPNGQWPEFQRQLFQEAFEALAAADAQTPGGFRVVIEPGDVPNDISLDTFEGIQAYAERFADLVEIVHTQFPQYTYLIDSWEVGNEPNNGYVFYGDYTYHGGEGDPDHPRYWVQNDAQGTAYGQYLALTAAAVERVENNLNIDVKLISAGILSNDRAYLDNMFATVRSYLDSPGFEGEIEGFTIHPYTIYEYNTPTPASLRATEWVPNPAESETDAWAYYHSFQGALYTTQELANFWGFGDSELYVTEFGVPSWLGYRSAGAEGRIDQAYWMAEAFGVFDSWGNDNLQAIMAHMVVDNYYGTTNDGYSAYAGDGRPDGDTVGAYGSAEGSFGLYEVLYPGGPVVAKPIVPVMEAIAGGYDFSDPSHRIITLSSVDFLDLSSAGTNGAGIVEGYVALTHDGADQITGSAYSDSLFAGNGNDNVAGGAGDDRIYGGRGEDTLAGEAGDDDLYGNTGNDLIYAGLGADRIDGGTGYDTLVLVENQAAYTLSGTGAYFTATGSAGTVEAINVEFVRFADGSEFELGGIDVTRGNGGVVEGQGGSGGGGTSGGSINYFTGTDGDDYITETTAGQDVVYALDGLDVIVGSTGNDTIYGAGGYNQIDYLGAGSSSSAFTFAQNGDGSVTAISTAFGTDTLWDIGGVWFGEEGEWYDIDDLLSGTGGSGGGSGNVITGTDDVDYLDGTTGDDTISALAGDDIVFASSGNDTIDGGAGYDQINYGGANSFASNLTVTSNGDGTLTIASAAYGTDTIRDIEGVWFDAEGAWYDINSLISGSTGGGGNYVYGTVGDDYLDGTAGDDIIIADEGDDIIFGSTGDDVINGGTGYNQVNYDDGFSSDFTVVDNGDGSLTVSSAAYGNDLYWDVGGVWFGGEGAWYDPDTLVA